MTGARRSEGLGRPRDYGLSIDKMFAKVQRDPDPVSIEVLHSNAGIEGAVVVIKGAQVVAAFHEWAVRNRILTPKQHIDGTPMDQASLELSARLGLDERSVEERS